MSEKPGPLRDPALVIAFDAWVDAGGAATAAANHLAEDGVAIARFDGDALYDYRARRPTLDVVDGELKHLEWQDMTLTHVAADSRDVLVLAGPEPDYRWKELAATVVDLASNLGVVQVVALGAIPSAVPHTRPVSLVTTATPRDALDPDDRHTEGLLRVPAAALSVIQMAFTDRGVPTAGFFAQVPHYVTPVYAPGAIALIERLGRFLGIRIPMRSLPDEARAQRAQLDELVETRPDVKEHIERLESLAPDAGIVTSGRIPSGDEIAAEVERFLRNPPSGDT